jgi:hypothetical protein
MTKPLSTRAKRRRVEIIKILSDMSRDWSRWTADDWRPLEQELDQLS